MVKDTCKQERKTQLHQVGRVRPSAERRNNGEADSGRSSLGVARAGAKQQAAGRGWPGATPLQASAGPRPLRARPRLPARDPPAPSKEPAAEARAPPPRCPHTAAAVAPRSGPATAPEAAQSLWAMSVGQTTSTGRKPSPSCGASSPEGTRDAVTSRGPGAGRLTRECAAHATGTSASHEKEQGGRCKVAPRGQVGTASRPLGGPAREPVKQLSLAPRSGRATA